ncbi:MAG: hypothetical protein KF770_18515 [Anaerolineae bacterium]|nr:hypothetical protein [Anaerolineae bacterium]
MTSSETTPSVWSRVVRVALSIFLGIGAGLVLGWLLAQSEIMVYGRAITTLSLLLGIIAGVGVAIGLTRFGKLSFGLVAGLVGYVLLGMAGYALLFGVIGLIIGGALGWQIGVIVGAVVGTAVGVYVCLIKYRYRHF